ncbi:DUF6162 family protein [Motiliproteus sp. MSK22-1]|uniref:DUF6162 family protein n=1 Tax=Motiliproteus sp. MSK22-1 TaxID=1897630 RepID=UPI000979C33B|nr:hypothetical protein [Motiliproteus sp. MSK22-1]OMH33667.1 hypothetical protein BGP75_11685 [Motiliproteus sp. MSK22-1]
MNSEQYIEPVRSDNGRQESRWVLLAVLLILFVGGYGVTTNQSVPAKPPGYLLLDVKDKAVLTALRNAGDEIQFLAQEGSPLPEVASLAAEGIPPFSDHLSATSRHRWRKLDGACYIGTPLNASNGSSVQFLLVLNTRVLVYWRSVERSHKHSHQSKRTTSACTPDEYWQVLHNA